MELSKAETKISNMRNEGERIVGDLLINLGFQLVDGNVIVLNSSNQRIGEIDLIFTFEDYVFLIEVSKDNHSGSSKKIAFFTKWSDENNLNILKKNYQLISKKVIRIYFDLSHNSSESVSAEIQNLTQQGKMNKVLYKDDYEYFQNYRKMIGSWAKNDFLDLIDFSDDKKFKEIDAIQYYIGETPVFCFVEKVENLLKTCYVSRRRTGDLGYQRTLRKNRVVNISNTIKKERGLSFPNSILINTPTLTDKILPPEKCPSMTKIDFPISYNKCKIIDGQHRLLGFSVVPNLLRNSYSLPVIALQNFDQSREIETFVDINSKQQRIDGNLILLLKADMDWLPDSKENKEKIAVRVVEKLDKSYFKGRIFYGKAEELKGDKITLTTLVSSIKKNDQIKQDIDKTFAHLSIMLKLMVTHLLKHSFKSGTYFGHNRGISVLFRLLHLFERNTEYKKINISLEQFLQDIGKIFNEQFIERLNNLFGEGGDKAGAELIINELRNKFPKNYKNMEPTLQKIPKKRH
jgi:DGQHR domain-containing protein